MFCVQSTLFKKDHVCSVKKSLVMSIILISNSFSAVLKQCKNYRKQKSISLKILCSCFLQFFLELCFQRHWLVKVKITAVVLLALFKIDIFTWYLEESNSPEAP